MLNYPLQLCKGLLILVGLLVLSYTTPARNQKESGTAPVSMDVVMQAIHDYGKEHQPLLLRENFTKAADMNDAYFAQVADLTAREDFASLEKLAQENRTERGRLVAGNWKDNDFFNATSAPVQDQHQKEADFGARLKIIKRWIAAYPNSGAAKIALARFYSWYAWFARGTGYANTVSSDQWKLFSDRTALGKQALLDAALMKDRYPAWYFAMQFIALQEDWEKPQARELLDQAIAFEPGYFHFYIQYANYLLPQWHGEPGEIESFASDISLRLPEPDGSIMYFLITSTLDCYREPYLGYVMQVYWPKSYQGYKNIERLYGISNLDANRAAFVASMFQDRASAHEAFAQIKTMDLNIWQTESIYNYFHSFADDP